MTLPDNCFIVVPDPIQEKTKSGLIISGNSSLNVIDTGVITHVAGNLLHLKDKKVRYRQAFGENLDIDGGPHLYFRDFGASVYYIIE